MARLPKSIIKKYGISAKAWAVFKGRKKTKPLTTMAKRKRTRRVRSRSSFKRRARSRKSSGFGGVAGLVLGSAIYGGGREYASNMLQPLSSKLPFGQYSDEVALGAVSYALMKGKVPFVNKIPLSREIGKAGLTIEAARMGAGLMSGMIPTTSNNVSNGVYL